MRKASSPAGLPNLGLLVAFFFGTLVGALLAGVGTGSAGIVESDRLRIARELDAIIVPAGGQTARGPPPHVQARVAKAAEMYHAQADPKPYVITTAWGTPHMPCPHDAAGFERHESSDNAKALLDLGVAPQHLLEESASLETVGNALYTRLLHTDPAGLRRLAIVNNRWHMARTKAVFSFVFGLPAAGACGTASGVDMPPAPGADTARGRGSTHPYALQFVAVGDHLEPDVLEARLAKEAAATPRFALGGAWRNGMLTLCDMWRWLHFENTAYAAKRLLHLRQPIDPSLLKSYGG
eukprot:g7388.t1